MVEKHPVLRRVTRTRDKWKSGAGPKTMEDNAVALGYIIWQLSLKAAKKLHTDSFVYQTDAQRLAVIEEYLIFLIHISDRHAYECFAQDQRDQFVTCITRAVARHFQRNKEEIIGHGNYTDDFMSGFTARSKEYSSCTFSLEQPGYSMLRVLATHVQFVMGNDQTNKWITDQVIGIDAPQMAEQLRQSLNTLIVSSESE